MVFLTIKNVSKVIDQHKAISFGSIRIQKSHLSFVIGIYPMLQDRTCFFVAADFDKESWREDAAAYLETCRQLGLSASVERSRSGFGGHIWLFFQESIPAGLARRLGSYVLTETMEHRTGIGLNSYDRFVPNQDTLPKVDSGTSLRSRSRRNRENAGTLYSWTSSSTLTPTSGHSCRPFER